MTDEEKTAELEAEAKAKVEAEAEAKAKEEAEAGDEQTPEEKAEAEAKVKSEEESKQFEAQLKKEQEESAAKDKIIADQAFKLREKVRKDDEEAGQEVPEEEKPVTQKQLHEFMAKERKGEIVRIVSDMTDDVKVRELTILTHKNRTYPANSSLQEQLQEAYLVANKDKVLGENSELKRALSGNKNALTDASQNHQDSPKVGEPNMSAADKQELARHGWKWNGTSRKYEKKIKSGMLVRQDDGSTQLIKG